MRQNWCNTKVYTITCSKQRPQAFNCLQKTFEKNLYNRKSFIKKEDIGAEEGFKVGEEKNFCKV